MRDLTTGSIPRHLVGMAAFIGVGLVAQTAYFLVDLYFVARLGDAAIAGVASAGASTFIVMAATQLVAVGALALIAQAIGRRDDADAQTVVDQALSMSLAMGLVTAVLGYTVGLGAVRALGADAATGDAAVAYLVAFLPSLVLMFPLAVIGSTLRAAGVVGPPMVIQIATIGINIVLAPVLVAGWGTGHPLGVAGAGWASSIATVIGGIAFCIGFGRWQHRLRLRPGALAPIWQQWWRITAVGLPASGEFLMMFLLNAVIFWIIRDYGAAAQAGYGIGSRLMQSIFLPAMAVAFATAPIAGQNFGAGQADRVRATFRAAAIIGSSLMVVLTLFCQWRPELLVVLFTDEAAVVAVAVDYLRIISLNFVAIGLVFACSGMFQALGDTRPALISSIVRAVAFIGPALLMARQPGVALHDLWYLSVAAVTVQALVSLWLLRGQLQTKLAGLVPV
ncbi:MATE family efflux transporter [Sandarakinorhabdus sp. DWP1-3-1]|uniref:MATE family efflux transporter n=1 Tax=Sandarakinorhabdus sp. DWP1-3-1 TaxID=2804627 RepID=UPI003CF28C76